MRPEHADITPVLDLVARRRPALAGKDIHTVRGWVEAGCDVAKDILPTLSELIAKYRDIQTFNYFTKAVLRHRDLRLATEALARNRPAAPDGDTLLCKARHIAWIRDRLPYRYASDSALRQWLEAYETEHGPVGAPPPANQPRADGARPP